MARVVNTLDLHIPDLSPPKFHRARAVRSSASPAAALAAEDARMQEKNSAPLRDHSQQRSRPKQPDARPAAPIVSPTNVAMFAIGLLVGRTHVLIMIFCLVSLLVLAAIRNSDDSGKEDQQQLLPKPKRRGSSPRPVVSPRHRPLPRTPAERSVDECFAFRPYG